MTRKRNDSDLCSRASVFDAILMMHMSEGHCGWLISLEHAATEAGHNHLSTACPCWLKCKTPGFNAQMSNIWKNKIKQNWQSKFCKGQKIMRIKCPDTQGQWKIHAQGWIYWMVACISITCAICFKQMHTGLVVVNHFRYCILHNPTLRTDLCDKICTIFGKLFPQNQNWYGVFKLFYATFLYHVTLKTGLLCDWKNNT